MAHPVIPAFNSLFVYSSTIFPNRWIKEEGSKVITDLSPIDYFLWGYLKV